MPKLYFLTKFDIISPKKDLRMKKTIVFSLVVSGLFAANCSMCHNGGYQAKLDKFTPAQISKMMIDFKSGKKTGMTMPGIAKAMSDKDISKVAKEFGKK